MYHEKYPLYLSAYIRTLKKRMREMEEGKEEKATLLKVVFYGIKTATNNDIKFFNRLKGVST